MDLLGTIKTRLGVASDNLEDDALLREAFARSVQLGISFADKEDNALIYANHILALKERLLAKEDFPDIEEDIALQVPLHYRELSRELLTKMFPEYTIPFSEVILIAIHLHVAAEGC